MFEKEAEENLVEQLGFDKEFIEQEVNKLKNPNNKFLVDTLIREVKFAFQKGAEFGYNKANEWHEIESKISPKREISKKYMPKSEEKVLLKYHFYDNDEIHISDGYYDAYDFQFHIANNPKFRIVCVIAWKELTKEIA